MPTTVNRPKDRIDRLKEDIRKDRLILRHYRDQRVRAVKQYVGGNWSEEGTVKSVPINLIAMYCSIVSRSLIAKNPRVMLSTFDRSQKSVVSGEQSWINREIEAMNLANTIQRAVLDGLIGGPGIVKVALATPSDAAVQAWSLPAGQPFCESLDLDDAVWDMHARDFSEVGYSGHRFRVPLDTVRDDARTYLKARKELEPASDDFFNAEGDERVSTIGREFYSNEEEFEEMVDLWEIYIPRHRQIWTFSDNHGVPDKLIREQQWVGPDCGPYHYLSYMTVPGNLMPKSPVQDLIDLHEAINGMMRKLIAQALRLKQLTFVQGGADEDGGRVLKASDGDIVKVDNPLAIVPWISSPPNQQLFALFLQFKEIFSWSAGNLDMLGGLSAQSKTATQDELLAKSAGGQVQDMQEVTLSYTAKVCKALIWFWHHHPTSVMHTHFQVPGMPGMTIPRKPIAREHRQSVRLADLDIRVDPYSLRHQTPESRMQAMQQVVQTVVVPLMQLMVQQGISLDLNAYLTKIGQFMDDPDLAEILTIVEPPTDGGPSGSGGSGSTMGPQTSRTYNRVSTPGRTQKGDAMNLASTLMGAAPGGNPNGQQNGAQQ